MEIQFDKNRNRVKTCPCGKKNTDYKFAPFIGYEDKGYCFSCGTSFIPNSTKRDYQKRGTNFSPLKRYQKNQRFDSIPKSQFQQILIDGQQHLFSCNFIKWLINPERGQYAIKNDDVAKVIGDYFLTTSTLPKYLGWILFPYIDINGNVRNIKAMDYDPMSGNRIKEPKPKCCFIGKELLGNNCANTIQCFFGEHKLKGNKKPVMIFEAESTAAYSSLFYPEYICLATGGKHGCKWYEQTQFDVLSGHEVTLYPDIDGYDEWEKKSYQLRKLGYKSKISYELKNHLINWAKTNYLEYSVILETKADLRDILKFQMLEDFLFKKNKIENNSFEGYDAPIPSECYEYIENLYFDDSDRLMIKTKEGPFPASWDVLNNQLHPFMRKTLIELEYDFWQGRKVNI